MENFDFSKDHIDLHMHTCYSDGSDTPAAILKKVKEKGIKLFSVTDHDGIRGALSVLKILKPGDPAFICGAEFSCKDALGKYHILGYGYRPYSKYINELVGYGHQLRIKKVAARLDFIKNEFGFCFPEHEIEKIFKLTNPGKPHIGNLMVKYGYADSKESAIELYINKCDVADDYVLPETAIQQILKSGGIPVLAHPVYGNGDQMILGEALRDRVLRLKKTGLKGLECFYSANLPRYTAETLSIAEELGLYVTCGSDYHGSNKLVCLGDISVDAFDDPPKGLVDFCRDVRKIVV